MADTGNPTSNDEPTERDSSAADRLGELVIDATGSPGQMLARGWLKLYKLFPFATLGASILTLALASTSAYFETQKRQADAELKRKENLTLTSQLDKLDKTESNLEDLLKFVEDQRARLKDSEAIVESLKSEKEQLEPIVDADRKVVDAIFDAQEQRYQSTVWWDRGVGFTFGVIGSLPVSYTHLTLPTKA